MEFYEVEGPGYRVPDGCVLALNRQQWRNRAYALVPTDETKELEKEGSWPKESDGLRTFKVETPAKHLLKGVGFAPGEVFGLERGDLSDSKDAKARLLDEEGNVIPLDRDGKPDPEAEGGGSEEDSTSDGPTPEERAHAIREAVESFDDEDDSLWTDSNDPKVSAVTAAVGFSVSRKEISAALPEDLDDDEKDDAEGDDEKDAEGDDDEKDDKDEGGE